MKDQKLLLHACCGPCSSYVWMELMQEYRGVTAFFFNPNIQPTKEYQLRFEAMKEVSRRVQAPLIEDHTGFDEWNSLITGHISEPEGGQRCLNCIRFRLSQTFRKAQELGFQSVATTLTVSRHKNSRKILAIGHELSDQYGIGFHDQDFKKKNGTLFSDRLSREWDLYRQKYCGCTASRLEREKPVSHR